MAYQNNGIVKVDEKAMEDLTQRVQNSIMTMIEGDEALVLPEGYSIAKELKSAMLVLNDVKDRNGKPALAVCTKSSIVKSLRNMVMQGLSLSRKQMYPIVYGNELSFQLSYFGSINILERMFPTLKVVAQVIHEGDEYEYAINDAGIAVIRGHRPNGLASRSKPIVGAYCNLLDKATNHVVYCEVMNWDEIQKSWSHAKTKNVQNEFPQEMAKRTVIQRCCKLYLNAHEADFDSRIAEAYSETVADEYDDAIEVEATPVEKNRQKAIRQKSKGSAGLDAMLFDEEEEPEKAGSSDNAPRYTTNGSSKVDTQTGEVMEEKKAEESDELDGMPMSEIPF